MMSVENGETIELYKDKTPIVKMPKKGGTGLNDSFSDLCDLIKGTVEPRRSYFNSSHRGLQLSRRILAAACSPLLTPKLLHKVFNAVPVLTSLTTRKWQL